MDATPPTPGRFTIAEWGILVAIVTSVIGALYAAWRVVLNPLLIMLFRTMAKAALRKELDDIDHAVSAVGTLGRNFDDISQRLDVIEPAVAQIPLIKQESERNTKTLERIEELVVDLAGRPGGRRRNDPP